MNYLIQKPILKLLSKINLKLLAISYTILIVVLSLSPIPRAIPNFKFFEMDKLIHLTMYFILILLWGINLISYKFSLIKILFLTIFFGLIIETLQYLLPFGRYFDLGDIIANSVGAIIGIIILLFYKKKLL